jgi:putative serine protease PepD
VDHGTTAEKKEAQLNPEGHRPISRRLAGGLLAAAAIGAAATIGLSSVFGSSSHSAATVTVPAAEPAALATSGLTPSELYSKTSPGVVDIDVSGTTSSGNNGFGFGGTQQTQAEGSGFVIDSKGDIVTNFHVVDGANSITVNFKDGTHAKATLVGSDPTTDIAVVHVSVAADKLHPLTLGNSSDVQPGEAVVAIGSPMGLAGSITAGIVSAVNRSITSPNNSTIAGAIQTDTAINHGNSGGPLIDSAGEVIGVNAQIDSTSGESNGVGFAIPSDTVKQVAGQLLATGKAEHAFLGVRITTVASPAGARIDQVVASSPASKGGLKTGDVIVSVDGQSASSADRLQTLISAHKPGDTVTLTVSNGGKERTVKVTLANKPS